MKAWMVTETKDWEALVEIVTRTSVDGMPRAESFVLATIQKVSGGYWSFCHVNGGNVCLGIFTGVKPAKRAAEIFVNGNIV